MIKFSRANHVRICEEAPGREAVLDYIPVGKIYPNPYQPRKYFTDESLQELSGSIRQYGLLQPISVRRTGQDSFELIAGERRLRASKLAGLTQIKALVFSSAVDQDVAMLAMIENLQRENLNFFEEAEGYQSLIREHGFTQESLARKLSKNQSTIANKMRILRLPRSVKDKILAANLTERHARSLLRLHDERAQLAMVDKIVREGLSVKATEELVEAELRRLYGEEPPPPGKLLRMKCNYKIYLNTLKKTIQKIENTGVVTRMEYADREDCLEVVVRFMK